MKRIKRLGVFLLGLMAMVMLFPVSAFAAERINLKQDHSLTVTAFFDRKPISGMFFDAYLLAKVDEYGELTVTENFKAYEKDLDIRGKDDEAWEKMTQTLEREILSDKELKPSRTAITNQNGAAEFTDLPMGLYLVSGKGIEKDGKVYTTSPFLVLLPEQDLSSNTWNYHVVANAKLKQDPVRTDLKVIKEWKDDCHKDQRPESITIQLLRDGEKYGKAITLPDNGEWSYTWFALETNHYWTVEETPVEGYKTEEPRREGNIFVITNTCNKPDTPQSPGKPTLPQTGQLWWPVPVLLSVGLLFLVIGLIRRRGIRNEK